MQLDLFEDWKPATAEIVKHPAVLAREIWADQVQPVAEGIVTEPQNAARYWTRTPEIVRHKALEAGATPDEAAMQVRLWQKALSAAVARLGHEGRNIA